MQKYIFFHTLKKKVIMAANFIFLCNYAPSKGAAENLIE